MRVDEDEDEDEACERYLRQDGMGFVFVDRYRSLHFLKKKSMTHGKSA